MKSTDLRIDTQHSTPETEGLDSSSHSSTTSYADFLSFNFNNDDVSLKYYIIQAFLLILLFVLISSLVIQDPLLLFSLISLACLFMDVLTIHQYEKSLLETETSTSTLKQ